MAQVLPKRSLTNKQSYIKRKNVASRVIVGKRAQSMQDKFTPVWFEPVKLMFEPITELMKGQHKQ